MKLVSLTPSNTEILEFLGFSHLLIGIDDYSDWPADILHLPRLGPDLSIDIDKVEQLQPDLVLASLSVPGMEKNVRELKKRGIPHIVLNPQSLDDIATDLRTVAAAIGQTEAGEIAAQALIAKRKELQTAAAQTANKPSLYWEWWPKPVFTPGKINWLTEISELAGGKNIFADIDEASIQTDWEEVRRRQPDYICLSWVGVRKEKVNPSILLKREGAKEMNAVNNSRIFVLEEELYCRPSPRLLDGAVKLGKLLHPAEYKTL